MSHYRHTFVAEANPATVYAALTSAEGLSGWWSQDCDVQTHVGGAVQFRFGANHKTMRITQLRPDHGVRWHCTAAYMAAEHLTRRDEWVGTEMVFTLTAEADGRTRVEFEHIGLEPNLECFGLCSKGWNYFMPSLKSFVETGRGTPFPMPQAVAA